MARLELPTGSPAVGDSNWEGAEGRNEWWSGHTGEAVGSILESRKSSALTISFARWVGDRRLIHQTVVS